MIVDAKARSGCEWYAERMGWPLLRGNVMVEGNLDVRYLKHAASVYLQKENLSLIGKDMSVFAAGDGDAGGTFGIMENFPTLAKMAKLDLDGNNKAKYRTIALVDDDRAGRAAVKGITAGNRSIQQNGQIFLLRRKMPRDLPTASQITAKSDELNRPYISLDCVIEDMLDFSICSLYAEEFPQHVISGPAIANDGHHWHWTDDGKFGLANFALKHSGYEEMIKVVDLLKSLRFYLKLPPEGI